MTEGKGKSKVEKQKRETESKEKERQKLPGRKAKGERERGSAGLVRVLVPEFPLADNFTIFPSGTDHHSPTAPDFRALYPKQGFGLYQTEARHGPADGAATTVPRASNKHSVARLTADAPCHPGHALPLVAPVQQEVARESRRPLSYIKKAGM